MSKGLRCVVFTASYVLVYAAVYAPQVPVLLYYPRLNELHFTALADQPGAIPVMFWYGWVAVSLAGAALAGLLMPSRWLSAKWLALSWIAPAVLMVFVIVHEWHWFTQ